MDLIRIVAKRSKVSDVVYIVLNLALAGLVLGLTLAFQPPYLAYAVVLLSKWRTFAVRPRFWFANLQTSLVDLLVGLSMVTLIWQASGSLLIQVLLTTLYAGWLLIIKPRSKRVFIHLQAAVSQFLALMALFSMAHYIDVALVVALCWTIGYVCARHILIAEDEPEFMVMSMIWGFVVAELGWLSYHWTVAYQLSGTLLLPQVAIIVALIGYIMMKLYEIKNDGVLTWKKAKGHVVFAVVVISILLLRELLDIFRYSS